jgi:hypothetical protein
MTEPTEWGDDANIGNWQYSGMRLCAKSHVCGPTTQLILIMGGLSFLALGTNLGRACLATPAQPCRCHYPKFASERPSGLCTPDYYYAEKEDGVRLVIWLLWSTEEMPT